MSDGDNQGTKERIGYKNPPKQYQWKKGVSANPAGRPKGKTLKEFAREYLESLPDDEKIDYLSTLPAEIVWKMAEGNPKNDVDLNAKVTIADVIKDLENGNQSEVIGQIVADTAVIQNTQQEQGVSNLSPEQSPTALLPKQMVEKYNPEEPPTGIHN